MDLKSGTPLWPIKNGLLATYPALKQDLTCDVAIIGGGISGAMVADQLVQAGVNAVILEKRDIGYGSTSASTSLLQYEIDTHLYELIDMIGEPRAVRSYQACLEALGAAERLIAGLDDDCGFERKTSLYLASRKRDVRRLEQEYATRRKHGFRVDFLTQADIEARFSFSAPAALLSHDAAQLDAYRLTHCLFQRAIGQGLRVYDRTEITHYEHHNGGIMLITDRGRRVTARKVVFATGYETQRYLKRKAGSLKNTYALASEPLEQFAGWHDRCLIWETSRPYFYLRTTSDNRIVIGGEDDRFHSPLRRDRSVERKCRKLERRFREMFPAIDLDVAYAWGGTFGETKDGLAYIGETGEFPNAYFVMGYGGNGITYSIVAAGIIRDLYLGRPNAGAELFSFER